MYYSQRHKCSKTGVFKITSIQALLVTPFFFLNQDLIITNMKLLSSPVVLCNMFLGILDTKLLLNTIKLKGGFTVEALQLLFHFYKEGCYSIIFVKKLFNSIFCGVLRVVIDLLHLGKCSTTELYPSTCFLRQIITKLLGLLLKLLSSCMNLLRYHITAMCPDV